MIKKENNKSFSITQIIILITVIASAMRFIFLGSVNGGVHVDEAFAGYESYSLLNFGVDSWGYHNPIYFISWGSGMNALASYLMMPFIAILGNSVWAIRLPQAILQTLTIFTLYKLLKEVGYKKIAFCTVFFMSVCPWHFMLSRWGLESNMCIAFITFGTFFLLRFIRSGLEISKENKINYNIVFAAIMFGLSLYCYAAIWIPVVLILFSWAIYYFAYYLKNKNRISNKRLISVVIALIILLVMATPLVLFILVNLNIIPEIRSFISIPKLVVFRGDEIGGNLYIRFHSLAYILIKQTDVNGACMWISYRPYGLFYLYSLPIMMIGVFASFVKMIKDFKENRYSYAFMLISYSVIATCVGFIQGIDETKINYLILAMVVYIGIGIAVLEKVGKKNINVKNILIIVYIISFILFAKNYFSDFQDKVGKELLKGSDKALEYALEEYYSNNNYNRISLTPELRHSRVLFYTTYSPIEYKKTVTWQNYPDKYLRTASFGPYIWEEYYGDESDSKLNLNPDNIYIIQKKEEKMFEEQKYYITEFDDMAVAIKIK